MEWNAAIARLDEPLVAMTEASLNELKAFRRGRLEIKQPISGR
jgi:hypothetical protein